ncbi:MAG TPA: LLM class flavin-dependent oxidoreductase [Candidatus Sulfotelmatobacter sp.]|nr:LLM class flavin-dependent oxidoreductase [Candidatus Sulfotelmatobacter sp.]
MRLTLFINPEHRPGDALDRRMAEHLEQVRVARQAGFDGVAIGHHLSYGGAVWFPPFETLARLAAEADGMTIGTCMLVLPQFHPVHVAQQAAFLDVLSGGRLVLGVAPGWQEDEFRVAGVPFRERLGRFVEAVSLIERLWTEDRVDFSGRFVTLEGARLALKPLRRPRPPLWFGGSTAPAIERAARLANPALGDSWVPSSHLTDDVIAQQAGVFRGALAALGKPMPADFPILRNIVVAPDRETALREAGPAIAASYQLFGAAGLFRNIVGSGKDQLELPELIAGRVVIGAPEDCAAALARTIAAGGFTRLVCRIQWLGMEQRLVLRSLALLAERVLPLLRAAAPREPQTRAT